VLLSELSSDIYASIEMSPWSWRLSSAVLAALGLTTQQSANADDASWSVEALIGDAYNLDSRTSVVHPSLGTVSLDGEYETRGFEGPVHYAWRVARWKEGRAWELQLLHHKLYLQDPPAGIDALSVSHGFNIVTLNRAFDYAGWRPRVGIGPVITHVEATIAGSTYDGPYELAGAAVLVGLGKTVAITSGFYVLGEVSATFGYVEANPSGAPELELNIRNPAVHAQLGAGYRF
jgi:hypothetical protein